MIYQWKVPGIFDIDPQVAGEELDRIYRKNGSLDPRDVVAESADEGSPLHSAFEWDDEKAADGYRRVQAQHLIRSVTVVRESSSAENVRAFVHVKSGYEPIAVVLESPDKTEILLEEARRSLRAFRARYDALAEMAPVMAAIDEVL